MTDNNHSRLPTALQSGEIYLSLVWDADGKLKPPLSDRHQQLYDQLKVAKQRYNASGTRADFLAADKIDQELGIAIQEAEEEHERLKRETVKHRVLAVKVAEAERRWIETKDKAEMRRWLDLDKRLGYAIMDEMSDPVTKKDRD